MSNDLTYRLIHKFSLDKGIEEFEDLLVEECVLDVLVNDQYYTRLVCTPTHLEELVVGHLALTGAISRFEEIASLEIKDSSIVVKTIPGTVSFLPAEVQLDTKYYAEDIIEVMKKHLNSSRVHRLTGGVHIMSLAEGPELLVSREDIGRHNAVDKLYGYCLINNINYRNKMFLSSGRTTHEIMQKLLKMGIKVMIGRAAVTGLARDIADKAGVTVVGFARGEKFNIYAHPERIEITGQQVKVCRNRSE
ncbi:MAG: formate dehydrogenase accessory sulfurtransferase FdhD [Syntrophomonas sp.]